MLSIMWNFFNSGLQIQGTLEVFWELISQETKKFTMGILAVI